MKTAKAVCEFQVQNGAQAQLFKLFKKLCMIVLYLSRSSARHASKRLSDVLYYIFVCVLD